LFKPAALVASLAAAAAVGLAAGYVIARDPQALRRFARVAAGGLQRLQVAVAETREEIADLWADAQDEARHDIEESAFAAATTMAAAPAQSEPVKPATKSVPRRRRPRQPSAEAH
jgi:hypothetical protein